MATTARKTYIANPYRKNRRNGRKNLSAKQVKFFGTPAQKAALKRSRAAKRKSRANSHRVRTRKTNRTRRVRRAATTRRHRQRRTRANTAIVHYTLGSALGNPKKEGKMAKTRRRRSHAHRTRRRATNRARRTNPVRRRRRNTMRRYNTRRSHRNPFGGSWGAEIMTATVALGGFVASKLGAQTVLGANNTGPMGYLATIAVGGVGAWVIGGPMKNKKAAASFFTGSVIAVVAKVIQDYTPLGSYLQSAGVGDATAAGFGAYMPSGFLTPQFYSDPTRSADIRYPAQLMGPSAVIASAAPPADMQASAGMGSLYGGVGAGLYN